MSSREAILSAIKKNKPALISLPEISLDVFDETVDLKETFIQNVQLVGGSVMELNGAWNMDSEITKRYPNAKNIVSCFGDSNLGTVFISNETVPHSLEPTDITIIKGEFGVAENGAVWISEKDFNIRVLPFITNDLVLILSKKDICLHMHDAYKLIASRERAFGLFLSGPSKTADIEQCLVIGAQGAVSLTVCLI